jgi:hypothetical protein
MSLPSGKTKTRAEALLALKSTAPSGTEARQGAAHCRAIADDSEPSLELRNRFSQLAHDLAAQPTQEDASRRESKMMEAQTFARQQI